jgi:predicted PurR-regulated permease PerM
MNDQRKPGEAAPSPADAAASVRSHELPEPMALGIGILATIAIVAALYLARAFFVPLLIGILASYALSPIVDWLQARRIPRVVGAALVLAVLVVGGYWAAYSLQNVAASMIEKLPEAARKVRQLARETRDEGPTAMQKIQEAATELQGAATDAAGSRATAKPGPKLATPQAPAPAPAPSAWLRDYMLAQSALLLAVAEQAPIVMLLAYFLLASGEHFRRKLVKVVGPSRQRKKDAVRILEEIDSQIQRYLLVTLVANVLVGLGTGLAFELLGMEQAGAWGIAAGVLHFIPYLGPVLFAIASGMAGFVQFGTALNALAVAGASVLVSFVVGLLITTWLQSRFARVNAAVLFIALLFFGWLWGVWGLLLGAPLVAITKVICDRVDWLKPAGEFMGH